MGAVNRIKLFFWLAGFVTGVAIARSSDSYLPLLLLAPAMLTMLVLSFDERVRTR